ncbi:hypothetical protein V8E51_008212 [Hyaloscypha variabilis]
MSQFTHLHQKKKRENGNVMIVRVGPVPASDISVVAEGNGKQLGNGGSQGKGPGDNMDIGTVGEESEYEEDNSIRVASTSSVSIVFPPLLQDEVYLNDGTLKVGEVLIWKNLESALRCLDIYCDNLNFWSSIRAVFLDYLGAVWVRDVQGVRLELRLAHQMFSRLHDIMTSMCQQGVKPKLEWLRLAPIENDTKIKKAESQYRGQQIQQVLTHIRIQSKPCSWEWIGLAHVWTYRIHGAVKLYNFMKSGICEVWNMCSCLQMLSYDLINT